MSENPFKTIGIIGGGAWGTALGHTSALAGRTCLLWAREPEVAQQINDTHENKLYLPDIPLHKELKATSKLDDMAHMDALLLVTPAQHMRSVLKELKPHLPAGLPIAVCAKGIEISTGSMMVEVLEDVIPTCEPAILSGPSFAIDVARGLPTAVTLAARDEAIGQRFALSLGHRAFRPYWSDDIIGVQLGGAIKNVLAIGSGIVQGRKLGASASASLISRGFAELQRYAAQFGAKPHTLMGLSGLGDLILTASSLQSRNMSLGHALGSGKTMEEILAARTSVSEGVHTAKAVHAIAKDKGITMPICDMVYQITNNLTSVETAIEALLSRPLKREEQS